MFANKKKKKKNKTNTVAIGISIVLSLLFIVIILVTTNQSPAQLKSVVSGPSCTDKSKVLNYGPITGLKMTGPDKVTAEGNAFVVTQQKMTNQWNDTSGFSTINDADIEIKCADGQPLCKQKEGTEPSCEPRRLQKRMCAFNSNFYPATPQQAAYWDSTATCTGKVDCKKECVSENEPNNTPGSIISNKCTTNDSCKKSTQILTPLTKTTRKDGTEFTVNYPVPLAITVAAKQSAINAAKATTDCSSEVAVTKDFVNANEVVGQGCMLSNTEPTCEAVTSSIECQTSIIKQPPASGNKLQYTGICKYKCTCDWPCTMLTTDIPPSDPAPADSNNYYPNMPY